MAEWTSKDVNVEGWFERGRWRTRIIVNAYNDVGEKIGDVQAMLERGVAEVTWADLKMNYRGRGIGKRMYKELLKTAWRAGAKSVVSSNHPSVEAQRVWMGLDRESEDVQKIGPTRWAAVKPGQMTIREYQRRKV